jgi:hypothetical protein
LAVPRPSLKRFSLDAFKRQVAIGIDGADLFDIVFFDAHHVSFAKAFSFPIHLVLHASLAFAGQVELPSNSWSRETFEEDYLRKRVNKNEEGAKDLHRRV